MVTWPDYSLLGGFILPTRWLFTQRSTFCLKYWILDSPYQVTFHPPAHHFLKQLWCCGVFTRSGHFVDVGTKIVMSAPVTKFKCMCKICLVLVLGACACSWSWCWCKDCKISTCCSSAECIRSLVVVLDLVLVPKRPPAYKITALSSIFTHFVGLEIFQKIKPLKFDKTNGAS